LRDFLLLFFFIALGAALDLSLLGDNIVAALVLSVFVLVGNPLIVLAIMGAMGYRKRTGFLAGLTVAQISEFSLIFMAMGVSLGHVAEGALGLVTLVGLVTIAASTYMITYSHQLYDRVEPFLGAFERRSAGATEEPGPTGGGYDVVVFGLGRYGFALALELQRAGRRVLGIDFDPEAVRFARGHNVEAAFGDASDPEFLAHLDLAGVDWTIAALPEHATGLTHDDTRRTLLSGLRDAGYKGRVAMAAHSDLTSEILRDQGADLVLMPFRDAASQAAALVLSDKPPHSADPVDPQGQKELTP